jgi:hypothetical protein
VGSEFSGSGRVEGAREAVLALLFERKGVKSGLFELLFERKGVKKGLFEHLEKLCPAGCGTGHSLMW